ncbi:hypothetical protein [uncultured Paraglaciecola sp.]|uniref:hypothetical protein n=1 Tax=uncultured Paraglaciecola sp. TaxID=1765024 RepID=UPI0025974AA5|nr:hypothetical protein [uncultured Paraglaciecola sp.]
MKKLTKLIFTTTLLSASLITQATEIEISIDQVTNLYSAWDGSDYSGDYASGRDTRLDIYFESYYTADGLLGFDLASIYDGLGGNHAVVINSATLAIAESDGSYGNNPYWVAGSQYDAWGEDTITFDNFYANSSYDDMEILGIGDFLGYGNVGYLTPVSLDVSEIMQNTFFDDGYLTLAIWAGDWTFTSPSEMYGADPDFGPLLTIDYDIVDVPEPSSAALILFFGLGLSAYAKRKQAKNINESSLL